MASSGSSKKRKASAPVATASTKKPKKSPVAEIKVDAGMAKRRHANKPTIPALIGSGTELASLDSNSSSEAEEDQTQALLAGFSSDSEDEAEESALVAAEGLQLPVPKIPTAGGLEARLTAANSKDSESQEMSEQGVVYVSRIPHGFYEHQMMAYFSQFGDISRLRMARNRRTGAAKHFAFIEFVHLEVAKIVAETMNNYLMFGHSLKVRVLDPARVHPDLFKGANKRFRAVPWNRIERTRLAKTDRNGWEKRVDKEQRRRTDKRRLLLELGYDFEMPELRTVGSVPAKTTAEVVTEAGSGLEAHRSIDSKPAEEAVTIGEVLKSKTGLGEPEAKPSKARRVKRIEATKASRAKA